MGEFGEAIRRWHYQGQPLSTMVATQVAGATAYSDALVRAKFKVTGYVNDFDSFLNIENIKLLGFAITILLVLIYVFAKTFFPKNANNTGVVTGRVMVDKEAQIATGGETNIATITYDEHMQLGVT